MRIRLDRVIEVSLPNMTAAEVATSTQVRESRWESAAWEGPGSAARGRRAGGRGCLCPGGPRASPRHPRLVASCLTPAAAPLFLPLVSAPPLKQEVPKFKIDAETWNAPYVPYAYGWWERFMLKK